jgi:MYXO-CTERM domain-containing protein
MDSGAALPDAGATSSTCGEDVDCAGGERCVEGMCRRVSCAAASDCAGGMTCVEGMCRNLCDSNAECNGGEVCDETAGHCVPVVVMDASCGCRAAGAPRGAPLATLLGGLVGLALWRRRRSRQLTRRM